MEIIVFHILDFGAGRREQLFADADIRVHTAADIEQEKDVYGVPPLGAHGKVEIALLGGVADRGVEVQLVGRAVSGPFAQAAQGDLNIPCADFDAVIEIFKLALVPDLGGAAVAGFVLPDAHAFGVVTICAKGGGACLLYTSPSPRDQRGSRMPSSA